MSTGQPNDSFTRWALGFLATLAVAGVIGVFSMSSSLTRLDERVANLIAVVNERIGDSVKRLDAIAKEQREHDRRIGILESRSNGAARPN